MRLSAFYSFTSVVAAATWSSLRVQELNKYEIGFSSDVRSSKREAGCVHTRTSHVHIQLYHTHVCSELSYAPARAPAAPR